ncbi:mCG1042498 [Mus musculus]|nr:mCG1042498 [Mus musculus]
MKLSEERKRGSRSMWCVLALRAFAALWSLCGEVLITSSDLPQRVNSRSASSELPEKRYSFLHLIFIHHGQTDIKKVFSVYEEMHTMSLEEEHISTLLELVCTVPCMVFLIALELKHIGAKPSSKSERRQAAYLHGAAPLNVFLIIVIYIAHCGRWNNMAVISLQASLLFELTDILSFILGNQEASICTITAFQRKSVCTVCETHQKFSSIHAQFWLFAVFLQVLNRASSQSSVVNPLRSTATPALFTVKRQIFPWSLASRMVITFIETFLKIPLKEKTTVSRAAVLYRTCDVDRRHFCFTNKEGESQRFRKLHKAVIHDRSRDATSTSDLL